MSKHNVANKFPRLWDKGILILRSCMEGPLGSASDPPAEALTELQQRHIDGCVPAV